MHLRLLCIFFTTALWLTSAAGADAQGAGAAAAVDEALRVAAHEGFTGVVLLREADRVPLKKAYGPGSCDRQVLLTTGHVFDVGSITKVVTAAAVLNASQRQVALDTRLGDLFPDAPADKREITVTQLLMHQSGFPESLGADEELIRREFFLDNAATQGGAPVSPPPRGGPNRRDASPRRSESGAQLLIAQHVLRPPVRRHDPVDDATLSDPERLDRTFHLLRPPDRSCAADIGPAATLQPTPALARMSTSRVIIVTSTLPERLSEFEASGMFYCACVECGRSQEYTGPEDNRCPACWGRTTIFCSSCSTYFREKPVKICPYCKQPLASPATAEARA